MSQLAIRGHKTRSKEVIEILEMLGGKNVHDYVCNIPHFNSSFAVFTLEEFLEKFPYKVGDKVKVCGDNLGVIISMRWEIEYVVYKVKLSKNGYETNKTSDNLQLYKEETMESKLNLLQQLKKYFDNTPRDVLEKEWNELSYLNEIGPTIDEYLECVKKYRQQNQYPKTYEECCKIIDYYLKGITIIGHKTSLLENFQKLLICRDAYWKIAGEQMGLGKPWKFENPSKCYVFTIENFGGIIQKNAIATIMLNRILVFPTKEMRDAFYENFKELIELCKELL